MTTKVITYENISKTVRLLNVGDAVPSGFVSLGQMVHEDPNDNHIDFAVSHVWFQHVQEALYKAYGIQDMAAVTILDGLAAADPVLVE